MSDYTPGPWEVDSTDSIRCSYVYNEDHSHLIATVPGSDEEARANALLIGASPALLKAAIQAYDALNELLGADYDVAGDLAILRQAINQALGKGRDDDPPYPTK